MSIYEEIPEEFVFYTAYSQDFQGVWEKLFTLNQ